MVEDPSDDVIERAVDAYLNTDHEALPVSAMPEELRVRFTRALARRTHPGLPDFTEQQAIALSDHFLPASLRRHNPPMPIAEIMAMGSGGASEPELPHVGGYRDAPRAPAPIVGDHLGARVGAYHLHHLGPLSECPACSPPWWRRAGRRVLVTVGGVVARLRRWRRP